MSFLSPRDEEQQYRSPQAHLGGNVPRRPITAGIYTGVIAGYEQSRKQQYKNKRVHSFHTVHGGRNLKIIRKPRKY